jgi:hypothetical protein
MWRDHDVTDRLQASGPSLHAPAFTRRLPVIVLVVLLTNADVAGAQSLFDFHSGFWVNLHHYLHALVRTSEPLVEDLPASATAAEREAWSEAVDFYRTRFGKRNLLFDAILVTIKQQLIEADTLGNAADPLSSLTGATAAAHRRALERAAPIYRKYRWAEHDAANKQFIATLQELLAKHGAAIAERLAGSYDDVWPANGIRADVVRDAGPPGNAYTTNVPRPTHITIGAQGHGDTALELIFHEASHHWDQRLMKAVGDAADRLKVAAPRNLWHALLFYNAGQITADTLAAAGRRDYVMMMVNQKIFDAPGWHAAISRHWPGFLSGEISRDEAILRILRDLPAR